jgi:osmotically-inducible protein OsmY
MKSDTELQQDVIDELAWEPSVERANIAVTAKGGVVTLGGFVASYPQKMAAEKAARRVHGVRGIAEEIEVRFESDPKTHDDEIAKRAVDILKWGAIIPRDTIMVKVEHGWMTLTGKVDWHFHKQAAERVAGRIAGVKGISNLIEVENAVSTGNVREKIMAAFRRAGDVDAKSISVVAEGSTVRLSGTVHSWNQRRVAEKAAWAAPGVTRIEDNILVA